MQRRYLMECILAALGMSTVGTVWAAGRDVRCDAVVVGAGGAGMRAAIALKEAGKKVLLLEKLSFAGGATNFAATYFVVVNTREQQKAGKGMTLDDYIAMQKKINPDLDTKRLREVRAASQETLDWLNAMGTNITRPISTYQVGTADGRSLGVTIVGAMIKKMEEVGVELRCDSKVTKLLVEKGRVAGVVVQDEDGSYNVFADNVILATGGYAAGQSVVEKYAPEWKGVPTTSSVGATGDAVALVEPVDGSLKFMDRVRMNPSVYSANGKNMSLSAARAEGGIMINVEGRRFCNDYYPDYTQLSRWMQQQKGGIAYIVIDDKAMKASKRLQGFKKQGVFVEAKTMAELAEKIGVPAENLEKTIETYRASVRAGVDKEFGRKFNMRIDFTQPPFYAVRTRPGIQVTLGGIEVDDNARVLNSKGKPIQGLFAIGEVAHDGLFGSGPTQLNIYYGKKVADYIVKH